MEVIKLSKTNILVILTKEDMEKYRINCTNDFTPPTRAALRQALSDAGLHRDLGVPFARTLVQVFFSKEGGCEMFVTGLSTDMSLGLHTSAKYIYRFVELESLLRACRELHIIGRSESSTAFYDKSRKDGGYFLELGYEAPQLCEFGAKPISLKPGATCYLTEHCDMICQDAVNVLGKLA